MLNRHTRQVFVIMGISGCGKSSVGKQLANKLGGIDFYDADDFHPRSNVEKMKNGIGLNDEDRWPWLEMLSVNIVQEHVIRRKTGAVLACSALKEGYRDILRQGVDRSDVVFVWLDVDPDDAKERCEKRKKEHFMPSSLIQSQVQTLDASPECVDIHVSRQTCHDLNVDGIVEYVCDHL